MAASSGGRCGRLSQHPTVFDVRDGCAESFDRSDHLAVEIAIAVHMSRRNKKLRLILRGMKIAVVEA